MQQAKFQTIKWGLLAFVRHPDIRTCASHAHGLRIQLQGVWGISSGNEMLKKYLGAEFVSTVEGILKISTKRPKESAPEVSKPGKVAKRSSGAADAATPTEAAAAAPAEAAEGAAPAEAAAPAGAADAEATEADDAKAAEEEDSNTGRGRGGGAKAAEEEDSNTGRGRGGGRGRASTNAKPKLTAKRARQ